MNVTVKAQPELELFNQPARPGLQRLHQYRNPRRMHWECSRCDIPHRAQKARLSDGRSDVLDHQVFGGLKVLDSLKVYDSLKVFDSIEALTSFSRAEVIFSKRAG